MKVVEGYLKHRNYLPLLPEEDPNKDLRNLTAEELAARKVKQEEEQKAIQAAKDEEEKKEQDAFNALDDLGKIQHDWKKKIEKQHKEVDARLILKRLNKEEKAKLFKEIRWGFLKHQELLQLRQNEIFELAKNLIVEGLSVRLDPHEIAAKEDISLNMHPRVRYNHKVEHDEDINREKKTLLS